MPKSEDRKGVITAIAMMSGTLDDLLKLLETVLGESITIDDRAHFSAIRIIAIGGSSQYS